MFACSVYPSEGELLGNIRQEAIDNVRRLRNHPSLAYGVVIMNVWKLGLVGIGKKTM